VPVFAGSSLISQVSDSPKDSLRLPQRKIADLPPPWSMPR